MYQFGEIFKRLGVPGMGRQGAGWCALDAGGTLVFMSHQSYYRKVDGVMRYEEQGDERLPASSASAARSIKLAADYFEPGKPILLPIAVFETDGGFRPDGTLNAAKFKYATGDVYRGRMLEFDAKSGRMLCEVTDRFSV